MVDVRCMQKYASCDVHRAPRRRLRPAQPVFRLSHDKFCGKLEPCAA